MFAETLSSFSARERTQILLDGKPVTLPPGCRSLNGIRSYLERVALEQQRILWCVKVDGATEPSGGQISEEKRFRSVEARTFDLGQIPFQLIQTALEQVEQARSHTQTAIALILINDLASGREIWWKLARGLKQPLMTLALLPEHLSGTCQGSASATQIRKWQLQQLGQILSEVDEACWCNCAALAQSLESRVVPWLQSLHNSLELLFETTCPKETGSRRQYP